jgi:DNA-binding GntR family transcriptional regulator
MRQIAPEHRCGRMTGTMNDDRTTASTQRRYEIAEEVLRGNIEAGVLPPGLVLLEGPIAEILQISRAPVQRALQALEADGLIHRFPGRGFLVGAPGSAVEPNRTDIKTLGLIVPRHADEALQSRSSWERIYNTVEADVAGCVIFGRYRIIEMEIANHFNVSRTVVRDVLTRLRERGLVRKNQSSHWIAGPLTAQTVKDHFMLRKMLEPPAIRLGASAIDQGRLESLLARLHEAERGTSADFLREVEAVQAEFIECCVLAAPNERLRDLVRNNLLPVTATERLLRRLGLPGDPATITELRLIVELLHRGATDAAVSMMDAHLEGSLNRTIAQMKIVAIIPRPGATAAYLTPVQD